MALRAGYYGIKKKILNKLLSLPEDIADIESILDSNSVTITPATGAVVTKNESVKNGVVTKISVSVSKDGDSNFFDPSASIGSTVSVGSVPDNCKPAIPISGANTDGSWLYVWFIRTTGEISVRIFNKDSYGLKDVSINAVY